VNYNQSSSFWRLPGAPRCFYRPSNVFLKPVSKLLGYTGKSRGRSSASGGPELSYGSGGEEAVKYAWLFRRMGAGWVL